MTLFVGYSGQVWAALYAALVSYNATLIAAATPNDTATASVTMLDSLYNGATAINAFDTSAAWTAEGAAIAALAALPLALNTTDTAYILNRLAAYENASVALTNSVPQPPFGAATNLADGVLIVPDCGLTQFYSGFAFETPPAGLTSANLLADAQQVATAFTDATNAVVAYQGNNLTSIYDTAAREARVCGYIAQMLGSMTSGPIASNITVTNAWNQTVTLPAMTCCASVLYNAPFSPQNQQSLVLRNLILSVAQSVAQYILVLKQPQSAQINLTTLRVGESLMDVAARGLGNFELWQDIATLNGLKPPYVGPVGAPGIAGWGAKLLLPAPSTALSAVGTAPSYEQNFLGTDIYFGPINGVMPTWTGDYQTITGYGNLAWALGRRLQTTITSLIYHPLFGSRIPPEVGAVYTNVTAGNIVAYGKSAILSDGRVAAVPSAAASGSNGLISFTAQVQPAGFGTGSVVLNEVISSLP